MTSLSSSASVRERRRRPAVWPVAVIVFAVLFCIHFQYQRKKEIKYQRPYEGVNYSTKDGKRLIPLSLGYRLILADFLWLRSIQAFGSMHGSDDRSKYQSLFNLFFVITDLDPWFLEAYKFGSLVMGDEGGDQEKSLDLLTRGMIKRADSYRLPYEAAYCLINSMAPTERNRKRALFFASIAAKRPDAQSWIPRFKQDILNKVGRFEISLRQTLQGLLESKDEQDAGKDYLVSIYRRRLLISVHQWQQSQLAEEALSFRKRNGYNPKSVVELFEDNPDFQYLTLDVAFIDAIVEMYSEQGQPLLPELENILASALKASRIPPTDPRVLDDENRKDMQVFYLMSQRWSPYNKDNYVQSADDVLAEAEHTLFQVRTFLETHWDQHGKTLPQRYEDAMPDGFMPFREPYGGEWIYDPSLADPKSETLNKNVFRSSEHPEL